MIFKFQLSEGIALCDGVLRDESVSIGLSEGALKHRSVGIQRSESVSNIDQTDIRKIRLRN
jgi:hypothetical protein